MFSDKIGYDEAYDVWRAYNAATGAWEIQPPKSTTLDNYAVQACAAVRLRRAPSSVDDTLRFARRYLKRAFTQDGTRIAFANGTLDISTRVLHPHQAANNLTHSLGYDYNPDGSTARIDGVLETLTNDPIARTAIREHIGLALMQDVDFQRCILVVGTAGSGKTTLLRIFNIVLGQASDKFAPGDIFANGHEGLLQRADCREWTGCALDEFPAEVLKNEELFKAMTAHSGVSSRHHSRAPINAQWRPKIILGANDVPRFRDRSGAIHRRLLVVEVPLDAKIERPDQKVIHALRAEAGAFAALCLDAARAAMERGEYSISDSMRASYDEIATEGDTLKQFVSECCVLSINTGKPHEVLSSSLHKVLTQWLEQNGHVVRFSVIRMSKDLRAYAPWRIGKHHSDEGAKLTGIGILLNAPNHTPGTDDFSQNRQESSENRQWASSRVVPPMSAVDHYEATNHANLTIPDDFPDDFSQNRQAEIDQVYAQNEALADDSDDSSTIPRYMKKKECVQGVKKHSSADIKSTSEKSSESSEGGVDPQLAPCSGGCGVPTPHGWMCRSCRVQTREGR